MNPDLQLALIVGSLFRDTPAKPQGTLLWPGKWDLLMADKPLAAYFSAVIDGGPDAWRQERALLAKRLTGIPPDQRGDPMNVYAIKAMLPTWREWGRMIIEAGGE
jgi:hypothetical protein